MRKSILQLMVLFVSCPAVAADLTVKILAPIRVASEESVEFDIEVKNLNADTVDQNVSFLPFLLPAHSRLDQRSTMKGVILPSTNLPVNLVGETTQKFTIKSNLPYTPEGDYLLGGFIDSKRSVPLDPTINNNMTEDLIPVGHLSNPKDNPINNRNDFFSDTTNVRVDNGGVSHSWRLFQRGTVDWSRGLRTLFLIADLKNMRLYPSTYEKSARWVNMGTGYDELGELLPYDRYSQSPSVEAVPAGDEYYMLTLVNYTEASQEEVSNNLDMVKFSVASFDVSPKEIWVRNESSGDAAFDQIVKFSTSFSGNRTWSVELGELANSVQVVTPSAPWNRRGQIRLKGTLPADKKEFSFRVVSGNESRDVKVKVWDGKGENAPSLEAGLPENVSAPSPFSPPLQFITLKNTGKEALEWQWADAADWIHPLRNQGSVPAGGTSLLPVFLETRTFPVSFQEAKIYLRTNASTALTQLTFNVEITTPRNNSGMMGY